MLKIILFSRLWNFIKNYLNLNFFFAQPSSLDPFKRTNAYENKSSLQRSKWYACSHQKKNRKGRGGLETAMKKIALSS